ncbi:hypothetical protein J6590_003848 [Homalodisca vitripennis]|nr:hypothetical protein J6590_003848 [Homalodisca vitripennis]
MHHDHDREGSELTNYTTDLSSRYSIYFYRITSRYWIIAQVSCPLETAAHRYIGAPPPYISFLICQHALCNVNLSMLEFQMIPSCSAHLDLRYIIDVQLQSSVKFEAVWCFKGNRNVYPKHLCK